MLSESYQGIRANHMDWIKASSSHIQEYKWDEETETLHIMFTSGQRGAYLKVGQAMFEDFLRAPSKGGYLNAVLKNKCPWRGEDQICRAPVKETPVADLLYRAARLMGRGQNLLYWLWVAAGKPQKDKYPAVLVEALKLVKEASGPLNKFGAEYVQAAIRLARERQV